MSKRRAGWGHLRRNTLVAALAIISAWPVKAQLPTANSPQQLQSLNAQVEEAYRAGDYVRGTALAEHALGLARQTFGNRDPRTLNSLNILALLYDSQGRYNHAERLYQETLQASREVLGPRHPDTLATLNNLADLYRAWGRYGEAEALRANLRKRKQQVRRRETADSERGEA